MSDPPFADPARDIAPLLQRAGSIIESEIRGRSMGATLPQGSRIRIRCGSGADHPEGAVIAFFGGRGLVGHRVVRHTRARGGAPLVLTRGDGTLICDPPVEPARVLGEVIAWRDGDAWRPLPGEPLRSAPARATAWGVLLLVRAAVTLDPRLAARIAVLLAAIGQRLRPAAPAS